MPQPTDLLIRFGLALVLGFAIGLEREREKEHVFAGMRTFALISLLGAIVAYLSEFTQNSWLFIVVLVIVAGFGLVSYFRGFESGHIGITTEVVSVLSFLLGALVYWNQLHLAAAITVAVIALLIFKPNLRAFANKIAREDLLAGLEFAMVWIVVLPLLPNRTYGPLNVVNPHEIWLIVVLVSAINLATYIISQLYGAQRGIGIAGVLGGMVSSTAVTFDFARRSRKLQQERLVSLFALAITIASIGMYFRVVILTLPFNYQLGISLIAPMLAGALVMIAGALLQAVQMQRIPEDEDDQSTEQVAVHSPFALRPALQFALLFTLVLWLTKAAQVYLGSTGTYLTSVIGGTAGVDAVALSIAKVGSSSLPVQIAVRSITLGAAANTLVKGIIAIWLGSGTVRQQILPLFVLSAAASIITAFLIH